jgi:hypothetical protein
MPPSAIRHPRVSTHHPPFAHHRLHRHQTQTQTQTIALAFQGEETPPLFFFAPPGRPAGAHTGRREAHPGRSTGPGASRWQWLRHQCHQPPQSGATQKRGAYQAPENAPSALELEHGREWRANRSALHFLNVPHINNRPLKTSRSYAK